MVRVIDRLGAVARNYDALYVDLWGCLHNGLEPYAAAVAALRAYRASGGLVVLLTNSPRPRSGVLRQLARMGVPADCYDEIASSGDATQAAMTAGMVGQKVHHIGPARDESFFAEIAPDVQNGTEIIRVPLAEAEGIVCTGLFHDETETPGDYRLTLMTAKNRGLKFLCANPDLVVDYGDKRIYCAGALAEAYSALGGESLYFGKPHAPIYELARARLTAATGRVIGEENILCIGDGIGTDIRGASAQGMDSLFLSGGLAAAEIPATGNRPDAGALERYFAAAQLTPTYAMEMLA